LQDHNTISLIVRVGESNSQSSTITNLAKLQAAQAVFAANQSGPLSAPGQPGIGFETIPSSELKTLGATDLITMNRTEQRHIIYFMETIVYPNYPVNGRPIFANESYISLTSGSVAPLSRGSITLTSNSLVDPPKIDPGVSPLFLSPLKLIYCPLMQYLTNKADFAISRRQFGKLRQILASPAFDGITEGSNNGEVIPGPNVTTEDTVAVDA